MPAVTGNTPDMKNKTAPADTEKINGKTKSPSIPLNIHNLKMSSRYAISAMKNTSSQYLHKKPGTILNFSGILKVILKFLHIASESIQLLYRDFHQ